MRFPYEGARLTGILILIYAPFKKKKKLSVCTPRPNARLATLSLFQHYTAFSGV